MQRVRDYIDGVLSGEIVTGELTKAAVYRHIRDLEREDVYFDEDEAQFALDFFMLLNLNPNINEFEPFQLQPFQAFIVAMIFGWKKTHNGKRKYNRAYIEIARKNGKTFFSAGISLYMMLVDGERSPQIFVGANSKEQALICFKDAKDMIMASPAIIEICKVRQYDISAPHPINATYKYLSSDASKHDGLRPHCAILDEIHEYKTNKLYHIFASAMGNRKQPLILMITTAGFNKTYWCYRDQRKFVVDILQEKVEADNVFGIIYTLDEGDDWKDPKNWIKSNPNLGVSIDYEYLEQEVHTAEIKPTDRVSILTKNFNVWMDSEKIWIPSELWDALAEPKTDKELIGNKCFGGVDLSTSEDITAYTLVFELPDGRKYLKHKFFVPKESARRRQEATGVPYMDWIEQGHLIACEGNVIDYSVVENHIIADFKKYDINTVSFDKWNAAHMMQNINKHVPQIVVRVDKTKNNWTKIHRCYAINPSFKTVSPTVDLMTTSILEQEPSICHDGNPVMAWMMGNVEMQYNSAGLRMPDKGKSKEKIDGVMSSLAAIEQSVFWSDKDIRKGSVYDRREARIL